MCASKHAVQNSGHQLSLLELPPRAQLKVKQAQVMLITRGVCENTKSIFSHFSSIGADKEVSGSKPSSLQREDRLELRKHLHET